MLNKNFWKRKRVLVTGQTGFKGSWLTLWLSSLDAEIVGYSIDVPTEPSLYESANISKDCQWIQGDVRDYSHLLTCIKEYKPDIIFHMAAQPLVRKSYISPIETYNTNVLGTVHLLEAARQSECVQAIVNVTSDKCYENKEDIHCRFTESDRMGGYDPYSASKGCAELVTNSYLKSFFKESKQKLASVRAGNVIGGGDWAEDRLIPDIMNSILNQEILSIRNPNSIRPWQHVLDPLYGYLILAEKLCERDNYDGGWNFGPVHDEYVSVQEIVNLIKSLWQGEFEVELSLDGQPHEAIYLQLDSTKAVKRLDWRPKLTTKQALTWTIDWYKAYANKNNIRDFTLNQISQYSQLKGGEEL